MADVTIRPMELTEMLSLSASALFADVVVVRAVT